MKSYIKNFILSIIILSTMLVGCDDFLVENPKNFISPDNFYNTESQAEGGLNGVYEILFNRIFDWALININYDRSEYSYGNFTSDYWRYHGYNVTSDMTFPRQIWETSYDGIKRANSVIENLEGKEVKFPEETKKRMVGEAKFLRALFYYYLAQYYGDVPLITETVEGGDQLLRARTPVSEVWSQVISDLQWAIPVLPHKSVYSGADISRASKGAARMLLAKVRMIQKDWSNAKTLVDEIISSGEYSLEPDITDNWDVQNEFGQESIFEIPHSSKLGGGFGSMLVQNTIPPSFVNPETGRGVSSVWGWIKFYKDFYNSFEDNDMRKEKLFLDTTTYAAPNPNHYFHTSKYYDPDVTDGGFKQNPNNLVIFRYADVLLMKAEIENEINNGPNSAAYSALNQVRNRSNLDDAPSGLSYDQFLNMVFEERAKELFFEGHRFFDLKRRGFEFLESIVKPAKQEIAKLGVLNWSSVDFTEDKLVLPLPVSALDANPKLEQNPSY